MGTKCGIDRPTHCVCMMPMIETTSWLTSSREGNAIFNSAIKSHWTYYSGNIADTSRFDLKTTKKILEF